MYLYLEHKMNIKKKIEWDIQGKIKIYRYIQNILGTLMYLFRGKMNQKRYFGHLGKRNTYIGER